MESSRICSRRALSPMPPSKATTRLMCKRRRRQRQIIKKRVANVMVGAPAAPRSVQMKVRKLQRLVPGSTGLRPDMLFSRTADYILQLRFQVNVLQALAKIYQP